MNNKEQIFEDSNLYTKISYKVLFTILFFTSISLLLILFSFDPDDSGWGIFSENTTKNLYGKTGAYLSGLNIIGLKIRGFSKDIIQDLRKAYGLLFSSQEGTFSDRVKEVFEEFTNNEPIQEIVHFLRSEKSRSICKPKNAD